MVVVQGVQVVLRLRCAGTLHQGETSAFAVNSKCIPESQAAGIGRGYRPPSEKRLIRCLVRWCDWFYVERPAHDRWSTPCIRSCDTLRSVRRLSPVAATLPSAWKKKKRLLNYASLLSYSPSCDAPPRFRSCLFSCGPVLVSDRHAEGERWRFVLRDALVVVAPFRCVYSRSSYCTAFHLRSFFINVGACLRVFVALYHGFVACSMFFDPYRFRRVQIRVRWRDSPGRHPRCRFLSTAVLPKSSYLELRHVQMRHVPCSVLTTLPTVLSNSCFGSDQISALREWMAQLGLRETVKVGNAGKWKTATQASPRFLVQRVCFALC